MGGGGDSYVHSSILEKNKSGPFSILSEYNTSNEKLISYGTFGNLVKLAFKENKTLKKSMQLFVDFNIALTCCLILFLFCCIAFLFFL